MRQRIERLRRKFLARAGDRAARRCPNPLGSEEKTIVTTFYDVEGDYAVRGQQQACIDTVWRILEIERRLRIRSTYNVVARFAMDAPEIVAAIRQEGHEIASHSYDHQVLSRLPAGALAENVRRTKAVFARLGIDIVGHRSPQSSWNRRLMSLLLREGFSWSAENGSEPHPYEALRRDGAVLWRFPVSGSDWYYVRDRLEPHEVLGKWHTLVRNAASRRRYTAIGFHPWVEARPGRLAAFEEFLHWLSEQPDIELRPFGEVLRLPAS